MTFLNLRILNNNHFFVLENTEKPPETEEFLEKLLYILQNKLENSIKEKDEYSLLSDEEIYEKLKKQAKILYNQDQRNINNEKVSKIFAEIFPEMFSFFPTDINNILFDYLDDEDNNDDHTFSLAILKDESPDCQQYYTVKKAKDIGYKGNDPVEAELYLTLSSFSKENSSLKKNLVYRQEEIDLGKKEIDLEKTFKNLDCDSFFSFFQYYPLYRPKYALLLKKLFIFFKDKIEKEDFNDAIKEKLATVFLMALKNNNKIVYEYCLSKNKNFLYTKNERSETALIAAAQGGCIEIIEDLISKGFDVNEKGLLDYTPLFCAAMRGHKAACELLIKHGADLNVAESSAGQTLFMQTVRNHHEDVIKYLMEKGINIHARSNYNRTALMYLTLERDLERLKDQNNIKNLSRIEEIEDQTDRICELLLNEGIDIHCKEINPENKNALMYAVRGRYYKVTKRLLKHGARINEKDYFGRTALILAIENQDEEIIQLLLTHNAEVSSAALTLAQEKGNEKIISLLETHKKIQNSNLDVQ